VGASCAIWCATCLRGRRGRYQGAGRYIHRASAHRPVLAIKNPDYDAPKGAGIRFVQLHFSRAAWRLTAQPSCARCELLV
jgi:hypothetical protein